MTCFILFSILGMKISKYLREKVEKNDWSAREIDTGRLNEILCLTLLDLIHWFWNIV